MAIDIQTVLTIISLAFVISNAVIGFLWKSLKDDNNEQKAVNKDLREAIAKKANEDDYKATVLEMRDTLIRKADKTEVDQRRNDIKELYERLNTLESSTADSIHAMELRIISMISELKGVISAASPRRR